MPGAEAMVPDLVIQKARAYQFEAIASAIMEKDTFDFRQLFPQRAREYLRRSTVEARKRRSKENLFVVGVRKCFHLYQRAQQSAFQHAAQPVERLRKQGRKQRTFVHRAELARSRFKISNGRSRSFLRASYLPLRAIAVPVGRGSMYCDWAGPVDPAKTLQGFPQDGFLVFNLGVVGDVLIVAAPATRKVRAGRRHARRRRLQQVFHAPTRKLFFLLG